MMLRVLFTRHALTGTRWKFAGMDALGARTVSTLKKGLPMLEATVAASEAAALDFFQFAFRYCLVVRILGELYMACTLGCVLAAVNSSLGLSRATKQHVSPCLWLTAECMAALMRLPA